MNEELNEDQLLAQHREDMLKAFYEKSLAIQEEIRMYEGKRTNMKRIFEVEYEKMINQTLAYEQELKDKLAEVDNIRVQVGVTLKDAEVRLERAKELESSLDTKHSEHAETLDTHLSSIEEQKEAVRQRHAETLEREEKSKIFLQEANALLQEAANKKKEAENSAANLSSMSESIAKDIAIQTELKKENESLLKQIEDNKAEVESLRAQAESDKKEAVQIRDDCDIATARLAKRKTELDDKEKVIKANEIRQEVVTKNQESREQNINDQLGKLSQLKSDVEILLKQKENKGV